jgi:histidine ammonia-lyase
LEPKEAIALISCNGYTLGLGAHIVYDAALLLRSFDIAAALSLEGFAGNPSIIHHSASRLKPHPGHIRVATRLRALLKGSCLYEAGIPRNLQDPLSFRCIPQVHGVFDQAWNRLKDAFYIELNSAGDNPLVSTFDGTIVSVGNFDVSELALSLDTFKIALAHAMQLSSERIQKHLWAQFSGLPTALADKDEPASKLIPLGRTAAALASESLTYQSAVSEGIEDYASMAPCAARKTAELIRLAQKLVAIELMVAARAVELRGHSRLGEGTKLAFELVRADSRLDASVWKQEFARVEDLVAGGRLVKSVTAKSKQERPELSLARYSTTDAKPLAINKTNI